MTIEEKQILLKDLCARLPYGVKVTNGLHTITLKPCSDTSIIIKNEHILPYLRPMSSMTEEERREYDKLIAKCIYDPEAYFFENYNRLYDWLFKHHFDFRGLIEKGLALEAPEDMYKEK